MIELKNNNEKLKLRDSLFWDIDPKKLNAHSSIMLIVERVLTRGNMLEFKQLIKFYPVHELSQIVLKIGYMDARSLNFISGYLNIPKENFLCYRKKLSNPVHCNF
ncbi:MAG: hypothetical protein K8R31_02675 [Bacteroidales bacterium]|nr:hypothetical protein [Bacteroidales bacterium]